MITDFTLYNVTIINPFTMEKIDQGEMRYRTAREFIDKMEKQGIPCLVEPVDDSDITDFLLSNN